MFNKKINYIKNQKKNYKKNIIKNIEKVFKKQKICTSMLYKDTYIHNGISFTRRIFNELFLTRSNKFNIFFKKPLARPLKRLKR